MQEAIDAAIARADAERREASAKVRVRARVAAAVAPRRAGRHIACVGQAARDAEAARTAALAKAAQDKVSGGVTRTPPPN